MGRYKATRDYRSNHNGRHFAFDEGAEADIDDDVAAWVNRDSPGTLERLDTPAPAPAAGGDGDGPSEPPRTGKGSGKKAWAAYAAELGVDVPADAKREAIIAAVDAHTAGDD